MGRGIRRAAVSSNVNNHDPGRDRQTGERETRAAARHSRMKKLHRRDATPVGLQKRAVKGAGDLSGSAATCPSPREPATPTNHVFGGIKHLGVQC